MRGAMVGGVGYMAGKAGARRAAQETAPQTAQQPPPVAPSVAPQPPPGGGGDQPGTIEQLKQLGELRDSGVLTAEEFDREKQKLLGR